MGPLDRFGNEIKIGSYVVYAISSNSSDCLRVAEVVKLQDKIIHIGFPYQRTDWSIGMRAVQEHKYSDKEPILDDKIITMRTPYNVIVLPKEALPEKYVKLFENKDVD